MIQQIENFLVYTPLAATAAPGLDTLIPNTDKIDFSQRWRVVGVRFGLSMGAFNAAVGGGNALVSLVDKDGYVFAQDNMYVPAAAPANPIGVYWTPWLTFNTASIPGGIPGIIGRQKGVGLYIRTYFGAASLSGGYFQCGVAAQRDDAP